MPICVTHTFWNYIINESKFKLDLCKEALTTNIYDYDQEKYIQTKYYQEFPFNDEYSVLRFPAGLTNYVKNKVLLETDIKPFTEKVYDKNEILAIANTIKEINENFEVRDYQINAVLASLNRFESLIVAATGSGKTSMMALLCKVLNNKKILILNGNNFILQQIYERLQSFGIDDLSWNPSKEPDYTKRIVLFNTSGSDSKLNSQNLDYINYLKTVETIIWDEAHHIQALTSFEPIFYTNNDNLKHIIGYTASPFRCYDNPYKNTDDFRTLAILGEPAFKYEMRDTIADGNIAQPYSYFINFRNKLHTPPPAYNNYYMLYRLNITYNKERNTAGIEMLKFLNKHNIKTLASFNNIKPGQMIMKLLKEQGIDSLFICGGNTIYEWIYTKRNTLKLEKRTGTPKEVKEALNSGYNIIFGSTVLDEGVDIDIFQAAVLFSAGKTPIAGIQRIGRASRKRKDGKNISFVIDFKDINGHSIFSEHYLERKKIMYDSGIKNIEKVQDFIKLIENLNE